MDTQAPGGETVAEEKMPAGGRTGAGERALAGEETMAEKTILAGGQVIAEMRSLAASQAMAGEKGPDKREMPAGRKSMIKGEILEEGKTLIITGSDAMSKTARMGSSGETEKSDKSRRDRSNGRGLRLFVGISLLYYGKLVHGGIFG